MHTRSPLRRFSRLLPGLALAGLLTACGGWWNDDETAAAAVELSGVAATGAAIANGTVTVVNTRGDQATARTGTDGRYTVQVSEGAPYILSVVDGAGKTWYSYAAAAGTAHITPLTTLALLDANGDKPLADLMAAWRSAALTEARVIEGAKTVNANLRELMAGAGVDASSVNIFNAASFAANRTGLDAVLDSMRVSLTCSAASCTQRITGPAGITLLNWNGDIATTGITVSWSVAGTGTSTGTGGTTGGTTTGSVTVGVGSCRNPTAGTYSLVVQTAVSGVGVAIPEFCIDGLPARPATQAEFCAADSTKGQLPPGVEIVSCSFAGDKGTIQARITSPLVIDYTVTYTFVKR
jgi:hypothetical protein